MNLLNIKERIIVCGGTCEEDLKECQAMYKVIERLQKVIETNDASITKLCEISHNADQMAIKALQDENSQLQEKLKTCGCPLQQEL